MAWDRFLIRDLPFMLGFCFLGVAGCRTDSNQNMSQPLVVTCPTTPALIKENTCTSYLSKENCLRRLHGFIAPKDILDAADTELSRMQVRPKERPGSALQLENPLHPAEAKAITYYTLPAGFRDMNAGLRGDSDKWVSNQHLIYAAASGLNKLLPYVGAAYRVEQVGLDMLSTIKETYKPGNLVVEEVFLSTSLEADFVYNIPWPGELFISYKIHSKTGRDISRFSNFSEEREVLFIPGSVFRVLSAKFDVIKFQNFLAKGGPKAEDVQHAHLELEEIEM